MNDSTLRELFIPPFFAFAGFLSTEHCEQSGTALTPGGRCLRAFRMNGITSNSGHTKVYVTRLLEVWPNFLVWQLLDVLPLFAPPRARGRRPRRAVGERFYLPNKARSKRNEQFAQRRIVHPSFFRFRGLLKNSIANSLGLSSRRAGGGFGHTVRVVLPRIDVVPKLWGNTAVRDTA